MKKSLTLLGCLLLLSSCATQTFLVNSGEKISASTLDIDKPSHFFINGLGQNDIIDAVEICGSADKVGKVETEITFLNGLLAGITFGIYTPYQYKVYCVADS